MCDAHEQLNTQNETAATARRPKPTPSAKLKANKRNRRNRGAARTNAERKALCKPKTPAQVRCERRPLEKGAPLPAAPCKDCYWLKRGRQSHRDWVIIWGAGLFKIGAFPQLNDTPGNPTYANRGKSSFDSESA